MTGPSVISGDQTAYSTRLGDFDSSRALEMIGHLSQAIARSGFNSLRASQLTAWESQIAILQGVFRELAYRDERANDWHAILEYQIPRR